MSKYEIELDDEARDQFIHDLRGLLGGRRAENVAQQLFAQIPIETPTKIGAIVRNSQDETFQRWGLDSHTHSPWIVTNQHEQPFRTDEIGRIVEVLSPGVDL